MFGLTQRHGSFVAELADGNASPRHFHGRLIDDSPLLLEQSYRLRYQVYCLERGFLPAEDYPEKSERDNFDPHSLHFGVVDSEGLLLGTIRLVQSSEEGLPMFHRCNLHPTTTGIADPTNRVVEVSRLSVSRDSHRLPPGKAGGRDASAARTRVAMVLSLYRAVYQVSKRRGITHWLAATETSLPRLLGRYGFPFKIVGPEMEYFGRVAPHLMSLSEFDQVVLSGRVPALHNFLDGLEPAFQPRQDHDEWVVDIPALPDTPYLPAPFLDRALVAAPEA